MSSLTNPGSRTLELLSSAYLTENEIRSALRRLDFPDSVLNELFIAARLSGGLLATMSGAELLATIGPRTQRAPEFVSSLEELQYCGFPRSWLRAERKPELSSTPGTVGSSALHWIECDRQYMLARCSNREAQQWLQDQADRGCRIATAFVTLWHCDEDRTEAAQRAAEAVQEALPAWLQSEDKTVAMYGQCIAGICLQEGLGCQKDEAEGLTWCRIAAVQGLSLAQFSLGFCYDQGAGTTRNAVRAAQWYRMAADQGHVIAQHNVAWCYKNGDGLMPDDIMAVEWFRRAAEQGYADAQIDLADMYEEGRGVDQDNALSAMWLLKAAEAGSVEAQVMYGVCCESGRGVCRDYGFAAHWFRKAAEQGQPFAQYDLAVCYADGRGVTKDDHEASNWYLRAAEQGHAEAQNQIANRCFRGIGMTKDEVAAVMWWTKAAAQDLSAAQTNLGICYLNGIGVSSDRGVAMALLRSAAAQGYNNAVDVLRRNGEEHDDQLHRSIANLSSDSNVISRPIVESRNIV